MRARVTAVEVVKVILRHLRAVRVSAAVEVRAAARVTTGVRAAAHVAHQAVQAPAEARVSARAPARATVRDRVGVGVTSTVIHRAKATAEVRAINILRVRAVAMTARSRSPAEARGTLALPVLLSTLPRLAQRKKRPANLILRNTRNRKILGQFSTMILIVVRLHL